MKYLFSFSILWFSCSCGRMTKATLKCFVSTTAECIVDIAPLHSLVRDWCYHQGIELENLCMHVSIILLQLCCQPASHIPPTPPDSLKAH